jgi:lipoprotein NlpI
MNGYFFTASVTRSEYHGADLGPGRTLCTSSIVCADNADGARKMFEAVLRAQVEGVPRAKIEINRIVAAQFLDQLLTEAGFIPLDWPQVAKEAQSDLESIPVDDFEPGYWVDVNAVIQPSADIEALRAELPEDIGAGLNWAGEKQFIFLLSVLRPLPPPPEPGEEPQAGAPGAGQSAGDSAFGLEDTEADFPEMADKEVAVLIRARNSAVAAWLWRKHAPDARLAENQIRIDPWCGVLGLEDKRDPDAVIADYTKAIELKPDDAMLYILRGNAKRAKNDLDGAIADFTHAIELNQDCAYGAYYNRAKVKNIRGDHDGAILDCGRAIELKPDYANAYTGRGVAKHKKGDLEGAKADYNKAIELNPDDAVAFMNRGMTKQANGDLVGAAADYDKAIELDPHQISALHCRGCLHYDTGDFKLALADFRSVIELPPRDDLADFARFRVWLIRARQGETEAANAELRTYLAGRTTGKADDWDIKIGQFLIGQLAEPELLDAAKNDNSQKEAGQLCEAYFYAGSKLLFAGDKSRAADYFQKSIATDATRYLGYQSAAAELKHLAAQAP